MLRVKGRVFCVVFGHGRFLIKDDLIERDFGIRVVLNSVVADEIRAVDTKKIEDKSISSKIQASKLSHIDSFSAKDFGNFLMGITGKSKYSKLGRSITGKDSFSFTYKYKINELPKILEFIYERYESPDYREDFEFFDRMHIVKDKSLSDTLDKLVVKRFNKNQFQSIILAPPDILEWDKVAGFKFSDKGKTFEELSINEYVKAVKVKEFDVDKLKHKKIRALDSDDGELFNWSVYNCIVIELIYQKTSYVLTSGIWFELDNNFVGKVNEFIDSIADADITLPSCHPEYTEGKYNDKVGEKHDDILTMDRKLIPVDGNRIEFCDLLTIDKKIIHVKPWKSSSTLSHLFSQGVVSSRILMEEDNRKIVYDKIVELDDKFIDVINVEEFTSHEYEIVYAIIYEGGKSISKRLPFFSRLNMMINVKQISNMNYKVSKLHIIRRST